MSDDFVIVDSPISRSATKFIQICEGQLRMEPYTPPTNDNITVISIIGIARTGKSSLLNCIGSYLLKENVNIFNVDDSDEHCTLGIDMYYFPQQKIVLLDCQGLKLDDSSNDPKLLLITYLISDCVIYNQRSILNNEVLETLQPLATFINYIEKIKTKPILLYFRLLDTELKFDPAKLLIKTLSKRTDQYQNVREAISKLFSGVKIGCTGTLDRSEKRLMIEGKFYDFVNDEENKFKSVIDDVMKVKGHNKFSEWLSLAQYYVTTINENKKIDFEKFDVYNLIVRDEIRTFIDSIDDKHFMDFACGILQSEYDEVVQPKIDFMNNCLSMFKTKFNMVNNVYFDDNYKKLADKLGAPINRAIEIVTKATLKRLDVEADLFFRSKPIIHLDTDDEINTEIRQYFSKIDHYYEPAVVTHMKKYYDFVVHCKKEIARIDGIIAEYENMLQRIINHAQEKSMGTADFLIRYDILRGSNCDRHLSNQYNRYMCNDFDKYKKDIYTDIIKSHLNVATIVKTCLETFDINISLSELTIDFVKCDDIKKITRWNVFCEDMEEKFMKDMQIDKIIRTKLRRCGIVIKDDHSIHVAYVNKKSVLPVKNKYQYYDKRDLKQKACLTEFNKWLNKRYGKKMTLTGNIFDELLKYSTEASYEYNNDLIRLYKMFLTDRRILLGKNKFIKCI